MNSKAKGKGQGARDDLRREERGASLVELMIGMGISMVVIAGGYTVMSTSNQAATISGQTGEMQQNARVAMELIMRDIKTAGFGMSGQVGNCAIAIVPAYNTPAGADSGPDSVSMVVPVALSTLANAVTGGANQVTLQPGAVTAINTSMSPEVFTNGAAVSINGALPTTVNGITGDTLTLATALGSSATFPIGTPVYWLRCVKYDIVKATTANASTLCGGNPPCLRRGVTPDTNPTSMVAIAEGIEDLQLAYACDGCIATMNGGVPDGIIDDQNGSNTFDAADFVSNSAWTSSPMTPDTIRLVRISIVARQVRLETSSAQPSFSSAANFVVEDHNPANDAGYSATTYAPYRRRLYTRTVEMRNQGLGT
jgi:type IV pilus assembly protein PilW